MSVIKHISWRHLLKIQIGGRWKNNIPIVFCRLQRSPLQLGPGAKYSYANQNKSIDSRGFNQVEKKLSFLKK